MTEAFAASTIAPIAHVALHGSTALAAEVSSCTDHAAPARYAQRVYPEAMSLAFALARVQTNVARQTSLSILSVHLRNAASAARGALVLT